LKFFCYSDFFVIVSLSFCLSGGFSIGLGFYLGVIFGFCFCLSFLLKSDSFVIGGFCLCSCRILFCNCFCSCFGGFIFGNFFGYCRGCGGSASGSLTTPGPTDGVVQRLFEVPTSEAQRPPAGVAAAPNSLDVIC